MKALDGVTHDLRLAFRSLTRQAGWTAVAIGTLALGIGANSALFTIVNAVVLRPLPYPRSERIVSISLSDKGVDRQVVDGPTYAEWLRSSRSLGTIAAYAATNATVTATAGEGPEDIRGARVTAGYFTVFGVKPSHGRVFTAEEDRPGAPAVAVLSDQMWRASFGADPAIVGHTVMFDATPTTVVGIMPPSFTSARRAQFWTPYRIDPAPSNGITFYYSVVARLADGASVTIESARTELTILAQRVDAQRPPRARGLTPVVMTLHDRRYGDSRAPLLMLFAAVGVLLLIACTNLVNLSLARAARREREFGVRVALGASRWRLARYVLCESLMVSVAGATAGLLLATASVGYFVRLSPGSVGNAEGIHVDTAVLAFTFGVALVTGLLFGLVPALSVGHGDLNQALSSGSPRASGGRRQQVVRRTLVVVELGTALVLLTGAGLVAKTFWRVTSIDPGFRADHLLAADIRLPRTRYKDEAAETFFAQLIERVRAEPGVRSAALVDALPLGGVRMSMSVTDKSGKQSPTFDVSAVSPEYFETIGAPMVMGRRFELSDRPRAPRVAVINATMARLLYPGGDAIGQTLRLEANQDTRIVGIVRDVLQRGLEGAAGPVLFLSIAQDGTGTSLELMVRTTNAPEAMEAPIRQAVQGIDPALAPPTFTTMENAMAGAVAPRKFIFVLLGIFAGLAAVLATIGLYGVVAYLVAERTREIGIRVALGADARRVTHLIMRHGSAVTLAGLLLGIAGSMVAVRALRTMVYQMSVYDPWTFVAGAGLLAAVALIACYLPARRASRVDPMVALRTD